MGSPLVLTGPPGAGKSTVARVLADGATRSVLIEGDVFFGFLVSGAIEPWLPDSDEQNTVVTEAAAGAAGSFARGDTRPSTTASSGRGFSPGSASQRALSASITRCSFRP